MAGAHARWRNEQCIITLSSPLLIKGKLNLLVIKTRRFQVIGAIPSLKLCHICWRKRKFISVCESVPLMQRNTAVTPWRIASSSLGMGGAFSSQCLTILILQDDLAVCCATAM